MRRWLSDVLPHGRDLTQAQWQRRHHAIIVVVICYAAGLAAYGRYRSFGYGHLAVDCGGVLLLTALAAQPLGGRRVRSALASLALLVDATVGVHLSGGTIEAHFAFFVVISLLMLYQDWAPFLLAIAYVVAEHGVVGVLIPSSVYDHADAIAHPWLWATIHGAFVLAASAANLAHWKLNEDEMRRTQESDRSYRRLFDGNPLPMWVYDAHSLAFLDVNEAAIEHYGFSREEFLTMTIKDIRSAEQVPILLKTLTVAGRDGESSGTFQHITKQRTPVLARVSSHPVRFGEREARHVTAEDVTERERLTTLLHHRAFHDQLTGLPNRALLLDRLTVLLQHADRAGSRVAVLFCDLDGFKPINDTLGHAVGDDLLHRVATRLGATLRSEDTLSRVGGDEFIAVCTVAEADEAVRLARRLSQSLDRPIELDGHQVHISTSVGVAIAHGTELSAEELIRNADIAMYRAKRQGRGGIEIFDASMHSRALQRVALEQELRPAMGRDEFRVHYQPLVSTRGRRVHSFEALVRWAHPTRGLILPGEFIGIAEDSGFILTLGTWVLGESCRQLAEWRSQGRADISLGINISARQLADPGLYAFIESTLEATGIPPEALVLEVTESILMGNVRSSFEALEAIKTLGVGVSIDDFGTGYSSLAYLSHMPLDFLKIDRSFVSEMETNARARIVASTVVDLAAKLGVQSVAEGVETEAQCTILDELGCDLLQGFHIGRPEPAGITHSRWLEVSPAA